MWAVNLVASSSAFVIVSVTQVEPCPSIGFSRRRGTLS
jgi:hypothetical protein